MKKTLLPILFLFLASLACGGIGLGYEYDMTADYAVWATGQEEGVFSAPLYHVSKARSFPG